MDINSYRVERCGIRDMMQFLLRNHVPKTTPVKRFCDNLSGVERGSLIHAPYRKWIGTDDDIYGDIRKITEEQGEKSNTLKDTKVMSSSKIVLQLA